MSDAAGTSENPYMPPRVEPPVPARLVGEPTGETVRPPIRACGSLSLQDGKRLQRLIGGGVIRQIVLFAVLALALFVLFNLVMRDPLLGFSRGLPIALLVVVVLGVCFLTMNLAPLIHLKRQWRQQQGIFQSQEFEFNEQSVTVKTDLIETRLQWRAFFQFKSDQNVVLIYLNPPTSFFVVPRTFFESDADWDTFRNLVERNVAAR